MATASAAQSVPSVAGLPLVGNLLQFRRDRLALQDEAGRIGPIARVQMAHVPVYVISDADLAHRVLVTDADAFRKSPATRFLEPVMGDGLLLADGEHHKRHRKLLAPAFAPRRLAAYGETMVAETQAQLAMWSSGQRIELAEQMLEMTLAIAGRAMFGTDVRRDAKRVAEGLELGMRALMENQRSPVRLGYEWPLPRHLRLRRAIKILDEVVYRLIREGRARGTDSGDVLSILLLARDEQGALTDAQVRDEVMTLLLAGHETTANALTWTWYELARHPNVLARLQAEVDAAGEIHADMLATMPYNLACIEETLRLHPPAYLVDREATRAIEVGGHMLPPGALLAVSIRGIHLRSDYYADPHAFRPERFLPEAKKARPRHHYLPFGAGPRVCIGSHFALLEAQLALATMVQRVQLRVPVHVDAEPVITLRPRGGMPATVVLRALR
jgi:cytochrome P450